jgi:hypothetical protein
MSLGASRSEDLNRRSGIGYDFLRTTRVCGLREDNNLNLNNNYMTEEL